MSFKINFSEQEASSEALDFTPVPTGKYECRVTDIELRECGPNSKNPGKPYWAIEFTVQDGEFENRKFWTNAMLFEGALYTTAQLLKATGYAHMVRPGEIELPDAEDIISKPVLLNVRRVRDTYAEERDGDGEVQWKNEVKGILPSATNPAGTTAVKKSGKGSILP